MSGRVKAVCVALALAVAGCGDDDSDQFREDYNAAVKGLTKANTEIGQATGDTGRSNRAIAKEFRGIADMVEQTRLDLARLDPPEDAKDEFNRLLSGLDQRVQDLNGVAAAVKKGSPSAASRALRAVSRTDEKILDAERALRQAVDG